MFTVGIDQNLIIWEVTLKEGVYESRELTKIRTKYCVDMQLKGTTMVSINKTQAYCYSFNAMTAQAAACSIDDTEMNNEDYMEGDDEVASAADTMNMD